MGMFVLGFIYEGGVFIVVDIVGKYVYCIMQKYRDLQGDCVIVVVVYYVIYICVYY